MVDQPMPAVTENQRQNGNAATHPAGAPADVASAARATPAHEPSPSPQTEWRAPAEMPASGPPLQWLGGFGGALLLVAGIVGVVVARRRRHRSRRELAVQAARDSAMLAASKARSLRELQGVWQKLADAIPDRAELDSRAAHIAKRARGKIRR